MCKKLIFLTCLLLVLGVTGSVSALVVQPTAVVSEEYVYAGAVQMIDNTDMDTPVNGGDTLASALTATHWFGAYYEGFISSDPGGYPSDFFASIGADTDVDIVLDLTGGGDTEVGTVIFWQYANDGGGATSVGNHSRTIEIRVNTEAQGDTTFSGTPITVTLLPVTDGDADPENDLGGVNSAQGFALGANGRYALLSITDNYIGFQGITFGGDRVGLSEVRFATELPPWANAPILIAPLDSDSPTPWDLKLEWLAPPTFTPAGYNIYLDPNELEVSNRNPLTKYNTVLDPDPNHNVTGLTHGETYYWLVEARQNPVTTPPTDPNWIPSGVGTFTTLPDEPIIDLHPVSQTVPATTDVTFTVEAVNATDYQWYADGVLMTGKTSPTLILTGVLKAQEGFYHCEVSNTSDTVISEKARLMVQRRVALWTFEDTINSVVVTNEDAFTGTYVDPNDLASAGPQYDNADPSPQGGKAIKFSGDTAESEGENFGEYVEVSDPNFFNFYPQGLTASAWVKITGPGANGWGAIVCKQDRPNNGWVLQKNDNSGVFTVRPSGDLVGDTDLDSVNDDLGNTWHLVTGTCDGETLRVYIDGALENEAAAPTMAPHSVPVLIGAETPTGFSPLEGLIDNLEVYNYALSRLEVAVMYTDQVPGAKVCTEDMSDTDMDFNDDCITNLKDFAEFAAKWLECYIVPTCIP